MPIASSGGKIGMRKQFADLKQALCDVHCMHSPVLADRFIYACDSSDYAVGACLAVS